MIYDKITQGDTMNIIFRILFKKQLQEMNDEIFRLECSNYQLKDQIQNLKCRNEEYSKLIEYILSFPTYTIYEKYARKDSTIFVVKNEDKKNLDFYLYSLKYQRRGPRILTEKKTKYKGDNTYLYIDDLLAVEENIGNGSILLNSLIKYARSQGYDSIVGWLSPVDKDHFNKLVYFYEKNGFKVIFNEDRNEGSIKLNLK